MAKFQISGPDGNTYEVEAPDDAKEEDVLAYAKQQFAQQAKPQPSSWSPEGIKRGVGLGARDIIEGATSPVTMAGDAVDHIINLGIRTFNAATGSKVGYLGKLSGWVDAMLTKAGLPQSETTKERIVSGVTRGLASTAATLGAAGATQPVSAAGQAVKNTMTAAPGMQTASTATGSLSAGLAREAGAGPVGQIGAGMLGGMLPSAAMTGIPAAVRGLSGRDPEQMQQNIQDFQEAGTTPTAGQATATRNPQATESYLATVPGSAGVMADKAKQQAAQVGTNVNRVAAELSAGADATSAGRAITSGVEGFVNDFKNKADSLYKRVDQYIPAGNEVQITNTLQKLKDLTTPTQGANKTSELLINPKLKAISDALERDMAGNSTIQLPNGGTGKVSLSTLKFLGVQPKDSLPYAALSDLRSKVGRMLSSSETITDIPKGQLKQLYGALSEDMNSAANAAGPEAAQAAQRASSYWKAGLDRIDILNKAVSPDTYEKVYQNAMSGTKEGATNLRAIMKSIPDSAKDEVSSVVISKLGKALPGQQNEAGDVFSMSTFLTNWNKLSPAAKQQLFRDPEVSRSLDAVAKVASNVRDGSRVFANPVGTAAKGAQIGTITGTAGTAATLAATGHPGGAALAVGGVLAGVAGNYGLAKLMTNPTFVKWLAKTTRAPTEQLPAQLNTLSSISKNFSPDDKQAVQDLTQQLQQ